MQYKLIFVKSSARAKSDKCLKKALNKFLTRSSNPHKKNGRNVAAVLKLM